MATTIQFETEITNQADVRVGEHLGMKTNEVVNKTIVVGLTIRKTVTGNAGSTSQNFIFEMILDESINGESDYEKTDSN